MKIALAFALLAIGISAASAREPRTLGVAEVVARHNELDGRVVRVRGWLGPCLSRGCALYETSARARGAEGARGVHDWLAIGAAPWFDRQAEALRYSEIVLEARVRAVCFDDPMPEGVIEVCADRYEQLRPRRIIEILTQSDIN